MARRDGGGFRGPRCHARAPRAERRCPAHRGGGAPRRRPGRPTDRRPAVDERVEVVARARPQPLDGPPRLLLDVHLGTLARRLRLLGVDTAYRNDAADADLVEQAGREDRLLLTRDRGLLRRQALRRAAYVRGHRPDDQLADVLDRFRLAGAVLAVHRMRRRSPTGAQGRGRLPAGAPVRGARSATSSAAGPAAVSTGMAPTPPRPARPPAPRRSATPRRRPGVYEGRV